MLKLISNFKFSRFSLIYLALSLLLVLNFQNCDRLVFSSTEDASNKASGNGQGYDGLSSGNGQGYDGFASTTGVYYQYIDTVRCNNGSTPTYSSKINFGTISAPLNPPQIYNNECSGSSSNNVSPDYLSYKPYSDKIITYEKGIFEKFEQAPSAIANAPVAFCQSTLDVNTGLDVLIRRNNNDGAYTAEIYVGSDSKISGYRYEKRFVDKFSVTSTTSSLNTIYRAEFFNLLLRSSNTNGNSDGSLSTVIDGNNYSNLPMICKHQAPVSTTLLPSSTGPSGANVLPTADFTFSCAGLTCNFVNTSSDTDGSIASASWSFGDGTGSALMNPAKSYASFASYNVSLMVTDNRGGTANISKVVTISRPANISVVTSSTAGTDRYFLSNNTTVNVIYSEVGASATATGWISSSTTGMPACPIISDYRPLTAQGWSPDSTGNELSTTVFANSPGITTSVSICLRNSATGDTSKVEITFR